MTTAVCLTIRYTGLFFLFPLPTSLLPAPCSLLPKKPELCT
ncbi:MULTISPECIES: hypothetical protein [unclassified Moorena]|nr:MULTISPECIES: hypothetical protein [unclassified Moorena]